jgi:membrane protease YdiL (CAAX protease family)
LDLGRVLLLNLAAYAALAVAAAAGIVCLRKAGSWLPMQRLRRGRWTGGVVLACFLLFHFLPDVLVIALDEAGFFFQIFQMRVQHVRQRIVLAPLTLPLLFAVYFWLLHWAHGTHPTHVGLSRGRWRANLRLGLAAFCLATPPVLGLYLLALLVTNQTPHQFEKIAREGLLGFEWALLGFNAIVAASLLEEWLFRGLLQGWLRRASPIGHLIVAACALCLGSVPFYESLQQQEGHPALVHALQGGAPQALAAIDAQAPPILWESLVFAVIVVGVYLAGVWRLWRPVFQSGLHHFAEPPVSENVNPAAGVQPLEGETPVLLPSGPRWEEFKIANARWAIVGSGMLFALSHTAWPSAVALVPLGLVLGWLAYRTQSLLPGIVLHALFNAVAFFALLASKV